MRPGETSYNFFEDPITFVGVPVTGLIAGFSSVADGVAGVVDFRNFTHKCK